MLEKDLFKVKDEQNKSLKWTNSSKLLGDMTNHRGNEKRRLRYVNQIDPAYNTHSKYISVTDNLLCLHYVRNDHLKIYCEVLKKL